MGKKRSRRQASVIWRAGLSLLEVNSCLEVHEITDRLHKWPSATAGQAPPSPAARTSALIYLFPAPKVQDTCGFAVCSNFLSVVIRRACPTRRPGPKWWRWDAARPPCIKARSHVNSYHYRTSQASPQPHPSPTVKVAFPALVTLHQRATSSLFRGCLEMAETVTQTCLHPSVSWVRLSIPVVAM
jgi:hypothetical protein